MRYVKFVFLAFLLFALPATTFVSALADEAPAAPAAPAAEPPKEGEKPPATDIQPAGGAFDTLKKLQAAGYGTLHYITVAGMEPTGWEKVEFAVGVYENQPVIEMTIAAKGLDYLNMEYTLESKIYYNGNLEVQGFTETYTRLGATTNMTGKREKNTLKIESSQGDGEPAKSEVIVEGLPDPPIELYALPLRYFGGAWKGDTTISLLNDLTPPAFVTATSQPGGKATVIMDDIRLGQCVAYNIGQDRVLVEITSGVVTRRDTGFRSQILIDGASFDNYVVNGKWAEARKAIAQNAASLLPEPAQPIADWSAKRGELGKYWKDLADKIPADTLAGIKTFMQQGLGTINVDPKQVPQETKDKLSQLGDNLLYYVMSQTLNNTNDREGITARFSLTSLLPILFPDKLPDPVRDTIIAMMYDDTMGVDQRMPKLLVDRAWDAGLQDILVDIMKNTKTEPLAQTAADILFSKNPSWADSLGLYVMTAANTSRYPMVVQSMRATAETPMFIGPLLDRCRLATLQMPEFNAGEVLKKIFGENIVGVDLNEFYCKWDAAMFSYGAVPDDVTAKANDLFTKLDAEDLSVRESAKKDLVAMGKVILPLLEAQRNNNSPEVRAAVAAITDQVVAPGYSTTVDFIRKNQYDRNLSIFIGYLACQTPSMRAVAAVRLKALTGQDFGEDLAKWYQWYQANKDKLKWDKERNMWSAQ